MQPRRTLVASVLAALFGLGAHAASQAGPVITGGTETSTGTTYLANFMQGFDFVARTSLSLTALGFWDQGSDGLARAFQVGLWDTSSQTLLASAFIDSLDALDTSVTVQGGQWRYENLASAVTLTAGKTYTLGFQSGIAPISATDSLFINYTSLTSDPGVAVINGARFLNTSSFGFPAGSGAAGPLFRANVNAKFSDVPEPATLALIGAAVVAGAATRRRKSSGT